MFKSPFSFEGRIRRLEYGLSYIIYIVILCVLGAISGDSPSSSLGIVFFILILPCIFFFIAQGAKRCHDRGNSGWFQLIPFYGLWMLFADSEPGINHYGPNPKGIGNDVEFSFENQNQ